MDINSLSPHLVTCLGVDVDSSSSSPIHLVACSGTDAGVRSLTDTLGVRCQCRRACNDFPVNRWVVGVTKPLKLTYQLYMLCGLQKKGCSYIKSPITPRANSCRQLITLRPRGDTTISSSPPISGSIILCGAAIEGANPSTRQDKIKVVITQISPSVCGLDNHLFSSHCTGGESQLVTGAALLRLCLSAYSNSSITIRKAAVHCPRNLITAHEGSSAITAGFGLYKLV